MENRRTGQWATCHDPAFTSPTLRSRLNCMHSTLRFATFCAHWLDVELHRATTATPAALAELAECVRGVALRDSGCEWEVTTESSVGASEKDEMHATAAEEWVEGSGACTSRSREGIYLLWWWSGPSSPPAYWPVALKAPPLTRKMHYSLQRGSFSLPPFYSRPVLSILGRFQIRD